MPQKPALRTARQPTKATQNHPWDPIVSPSSCGHCRSGAQRRGIKKALARFIIFGRSYYPYLFNFHSFSYKYSTTQRTYSTQHRQYTSTHSIQCPKYTAHYTTSHHITFCTCLVLILVVMCSFGFSVFFHTYTRAHMRPQPPVILRVLRRAQVSGPERGGDLCLSRAKSGKTLAKAYFDIDW